MARSARPDRPGARIVAGTRRAVRPSGPPTDELPVSTGPDGVPVETARAVIDLALRAGIAMLATGAAASDVVATVRALTQAYGLRGVHVDITFTSIAVSYHRGPYADPMTVLRVVTFRTQDFTRLERLRELVTDLAAHPVALEEARVRFDSVVSAPHPYRRWVVTTASATLAAAVAVLIGAGWLVTVLSFASAVLVDRLQYALARAGVASFFSQCLAAAVPTVLATLVVFVALRGSDTAGRASPSLIVAAGIVLLLSGLSVVGAASDALEGFYVTAGARAFEVVVLTLGIVIGVTAVLAVGNRVGLYMAVSPAATLERNLPLQLLCAAVIAGAFAVSAYARGRVVLVGALLGLGGWALFTLFEQTVGLGSSVSGSLAAGVIGFAARATARRTGAAALPVSTSAIVPLLPGRAVYQGISEIVSTDGEALQTGLATLAGAGFAGLGLAAGVSLGTYFAGLVSARRHGRAMLPATAALAPLPAEAPGESGSSGASRASGASGGDVSKGTRRRAYGSGPPREG